MLDLDALQGILALVTALGPASEAEYYTKDQGRPSYKLVWCYPELQALKSPPSLPSLHSKRRYAGYWCVSLFFSGTACAFQQ